MFKMVKYLLRFLIFILLNINFTTTDIVEEINEYRRNQELLKEQIELFNKTSTIAFNKLINLNTKTSSTEIVTTTADVLESEVDEGTMTETEEISTPIANLESSFLRGGETYENGEAMPFSFASPQMVSELHTHDQPYSFFEDKNNILFHNEEGIPHRPHFTQALPHRSYNFTQALPHRRYNWSLERSPVRTEKVNPPNWLFRNFQKENKNLKNLDKGTHEKIIMDESIASATASTITTITTTTAKTNTQVFHNKKLKMGSKSSKTTVKMARTKFWDFLVTIVYGRYVAGTGVLISSILVLTTGNVGVLTENDRTKFEKCAGKIGIRVGSGDKFYRMCQDIDMDCTMKGPCFLPQPVMAIHEHDHVVSIDRIVIHPEFRALDSDEFTNNGIALIRLMEDFPDAKTMEITKSPTKTENCKFAVWSYYLKDVNTPCKLKEMMVQIWKPDIYERLSYLRNNLTELDLNETTIQSFYKSKFFSENDNFNFYSTDYGAPVICDNIVKGIFVHTFSVINKTGDRDEKRMINVYEDLFSNVVWLDRIIYLITTTISPTQELKMRSADLAIAVRSCQPLVLFSVYISLHLNFYNR